LNNIITYFIVFNIKMSGIQSNQDNPTPNSTLFPNFMESQPLLDDSRINEYIRKLLNTFPDACWGGSSVLHDVVFSPIESTNKTWDARDFDIYCFEHDYNKIILFLKTCPTVYFLRTIPTINKISYANLDIKGLTEYMIKPNGFGSGLQRKLQLVNLGKKLNYSDLAKAVDLSFCSVVVSNNTIYYLRTTKTDVLEKRGTLLIKPCMCESCLKNNRNQLNSKMVQRVKKYRARGFTITNICQFCDYSMNTVEHTQLCLAGKLINKTIKSDGLYSILVGYDKSKLEIDEINQLISYSHQYKNDSVILLSIYSIFTYFKRIDLLHSFWDEIKSSIDISSLMKCSQLLIKDGLYTGFRLLFEHLFPHHINAIQAEERTNYIQQLMEITIKQNYIQCALLIQSRIPTIELNIYEDRLFTWKNRVVYEILFELINTEESSQDEIDSLMKTIPFVEKLEATDPALQTTCPICKYDDCSTKMIPCGHSFCQNCIILQLMTTYETSRKEMCPCCRAEYYYLTKRGFDV